MEKGGEGGDVVTQKEENQIAKQDALKTTLSKGFIPQIIP